MLGKATVTVTSSSTVSCNIGQFIVIFSQLQSTQSFLKLKEYQKGEKPETESLRTQLLRVPVSFVAVAELNPGLLVQAPNKQFFFVCFRGLEH